MVTVEEVACKMPENVRTSPWGRHEPIPATLGWSRTESDLLPALATEESILQGETCSHGETLRDMTGRTSVPETAWVLPSENKKANLSIAFASVAWTRMARLRQHTKSKLSRATQLVSSLKAVLLWSSDKEIKRLFKCKCLIEPRESDTSLKCYSPPSSSLCS